MPKTTRKPAKNAKRRGRAPASGAAPGTAFAVLARAALERGRPDAIPDDVLREVLTAAVKVYAAKVERRGELAPFAEDAVTATETVVTACAMIRAAELNLFDVAMWFHRPSRAGE
jgi:hypothetical protein